MPKGFPGRGRGGSGHKGLRRHFTNPDQLTANIEKKEKERQWRQQRGELSSDEESGDEEKSSSEESSEAEGAEEGEDEKQSKAKGVQHLIEIENPNRVVKKEKKVETIKVEEESSAQLTRREREEIDKQRAKVHYQKMHAAGKTNEAKADLARLAIIKKQREDAAKRREEELKAKAEAEQAKASATKKALGKKT